MRADPSGLAVDLTDGRVATLRPGVEADWEDLYALDLALVEDGRGQVRTAADLPSRDRYAQRMLTRLEREVLWVAELDGRVVAEGTVDRLRPSLVSHVGSLGIGVHPDAQGLGLGRALTAAIVDAARQAGIVRLELYVRGDNARAIALYRSLGFERESIRKRFVRLADGSELDDWCMVLFLDR